MAENINDAEAPESLDETTKIDDKPGEQINAETKKGIEEDVLQALESPAQKNARDLLQSTPESAAAIETEGDVQADQIPSLQGDDDKEENEDIELREISQDKVPEGKSISESKADSQQYREPTKEPMTGAGALSERISDDESNAASITTTESNSRTPISKARKSGATPISKRKVESPQESQTPQIGTTLLRRESLRTRASPCKKGSAQKSRSPQKRHGLKKRDTLQEREILQQFNAAASPNQASNTESLANADREASPVKFSPSRSPIAAEDGRSTENPSKISQTESAPEIETNAQIGDGVFEKSTDSKDLVEAVEAIKECQYSSNEEVNAVLDEITPLLVANEGTDQANDMVVELEAEDASQCTAKVSEKTDLPTRKTRSGARISDDTSVLKDFLNRAQAKKAAKNVPSLSADIPKLQGSPIRRSPRKALERHGSDTVSPQKTRKPGKGPSTPPRKALVEEADSSDEQETVHEPASFRRSTRTRLPAPAKTPPGAPSFIPVRRGDGSDQVVLQKSHAQEMAIVTRANTRRNKGQSKPPLLALQELPADSPVKMTAKERAADRAKSVAWAEQLASYWMSNKDALVDNPEEQRPRVRRMRGLGPVNGTPAKKSTGSGSGVAGSSSSNGTPAPKRRSKTK